MLSMKGAQGTIESEDVRPSPTRLRVQQGTIDTPSPSDSFSQVGKERNEGREGRREEEGEENFVTGRIYFQEGDRGRGGFMGL